MGTEIVGVDSISVDNISLDANEVFVTDGTGPLGLTVTNPADNRLQLFGDGGSKIIWQVEGRGPQDSVYPPERESTLKDERPQERRDWIPERRDRANVRRIAWWWTRAIASGLVSSAVGFAIAYWQDIKLYLGL